MNYEQELYMEYNSLHTHKYNTYKLHIYNSLMNAQYTFYNNLACSHSATFVKNILIMMYIICAGWPIKNDCWLYFTNEIAELWEKNYFKEGNQTWKLFWREMVAKRQNQQTRIIKKLQFSVIFKAFRPLFVLCILSHLQK